jgi:hypothetical protein
MYRANTGLRRFHAAEKSFISDAAKSDAGQSKPTVRIQESGD